MSYGVSANGFVRKRYPEIKVSVENRFKEVFGDIRTDPQSVFGQLIGVLSDTIATQWEVSEKVYYSHYPMSAEGKQLDDVSSLIGITRKSSSKSKVMLTISGDVNTSFGSSPFIVESRFGDDFKIDSASKIEDLGSLAGATGSKYVQGVSYVVLEPLAGITYSITIRGITASYTSPTDSKSEIIDGLYSSVVASPISEGSIVEKAVVSGEPVLTIAPSTVSTIEVGEYSAELKAEQGFRFSAVDGGSVDLVQGDFGIVKTPVAGIISEVVSYDDGQIGRDVETDAEFRARRKRSLSLFGGSSVDAIRSQILEVVDGVSQVLVVENDLEIIVDGLEPHSIACVVDGGYDTDIAKAIFDVKSAGIYTNGTTAVRVEDVQGNSHTIRFSRPRAESFNISIVIELNSEEEFPTGGIEQIKNSIVEFVGSKVGIGDDVIYQKLFTPIYATSGIAEANMGIRLNSDGIADPYDATHKSNITIGFSDIAKVVAGDIEIVVIGGTI